jgi:hypothetical protein
MLDHEFPYTELVVLDKELIIDPSMEEISFR